MKIYFHVWKESSRLLSYCPDEDVFQVLSLVFKLHEASCRSKWMMLHFKVRDRFFVPLSWCWICTSTPQASLAPSFSMKCRQVLPRKEKRSLVYSMYSVHLPAPPQIFWHLQKSAFTFLSGPQQTLVYKGSTTSLASTQQGSGVSIYTLSSSSILSSSSCVVSWSTDSI